MPWTAGLPIKGNMMTNYDELKEKLGSKMISYNFGKNQKKWGEMFFPIFHADFRLGQVK